MQTIKGQFTPVSIEPRTLNSDQIADFNRDGYIIIPGLLDQHEVRSMKQLHVQAEARAQEHGESFEIDGAFYDVEELAGDHPSGKTHALRKIQEVYKSEEVFSSVMASDKILDIAEDLIGSEIYYHSSKLMCKPGHGGRRKPWHQDWAYWEEMNTNQITVWIAIDPATTENGCMQVIPGSHLDGYLDHYHGEDYMIHEEQLDESRIVIAEMNPGDALIFNVLTLHASDPNMSAHDRLSGIIDFDSQPPPHQHTYGSNKTLR